jgi:cobalamin biosynthesis Mg chelatase CobN
MSQPEPKELKEEPAETSHGAATAFSAAAATAATAGAAVKSTATATYDELKDQLAKAEAMIASLKNEATSGLRQRKPAAATTTSEESGAVQNGELAQAERQGTEGVPVQVVAILCLISFLLAYFFF